jgi:hypothetical protein
MSASLGTEIDGDINLARGEGARAMVRATSESIVTRTTGEVVKEPGGWEFTWKSEGA